MAFVVTVNKRESVEQIPYLPLPPPHTLKRVAKTE